MPVPARFPAQLRSLRMWLLVDLSEDLEIGASYDAVLAAVAHLELLEELWILVGVSTEHWAAADCSLVALARLPRLRALALRFSGFDVPLLSDAHVAELRSLKSLEVFKVDRLDTPLLSRLLAPPHTLRWQELGGLWNLSEDDAALLVSQPLCTLDARLAMPHADFLLQLPQLQTLKFSSAGTVPVDSGRILQAVGSCAALRKLTLEDRAGEFGMHFTSAQLSGCVASLSNLRFLQLDGATELTTLSFLSAGNLSRTLTELYLYNFPRRIPHNEFEHLLVLQELCALSLHNVFDLPLSAADLALLAPRTQSPLLPHLTNFSHRYQPRAL